MTKMALNTLEAPPIAVGNGVRCAALEETDHEPAGRKYREAA
jgi:hypothetical protein